MLVYLAQTLPEKRPRAAHTIPDMIGRITRHIWWNYNCWNSNRLAPQSLRALDDRMLKDIGITRTLLNFSIAQGASQATCALQKHASGQYGYKV
jgi:uncharacterized protein YjiS (DUF1127 family)